jgi:hypothetical protein
MRLPGFSADVAISQHKDGNVNRLRPTLDAGSVVPAAATDCAEVRATCVALYGNGRFCRKLMKKLSC